MEYGRLGNPTERVSRARARGLCCEWHIPLSHWLSGGGDRILYAAAPRCQERATAACWLQLQTRSWHSALPRQAEAHGRQRVHSSLVGPAKAVAAVDDTEQSSRQPARTRRAYELPSPILCLGATAEHEPTVLCIRKNFLPSVLYVSEPGPWDRARGNRYRRVNCQCK